MNGRWIKDREEARRRKVASLWIRDTLKRAMRTVPRSCKARVWEILGYSRQELIARLESTFQPGMSWANWGEWHIDHINPVAKFETGADIRTINALDNLQALWATVNRRKSDKVA